MKNSIYNETLRGLEERLMAAAQAKFRAKQIFEWLYKKRVTTWEAMTNLPAALLAWLEATYLILPLRRVRDVAASDTTLKRLFELGDGALIETVLLRAPEANADERRTLCVSSQVGCAFGCKFCASGLKGFKRNLDVGEIIGQIVDCADPKGELPFDNLVFMGMGEPLANFDAVVATMRLLQNKAAFGISGRRMTVSTSGLAPMIRDLADTGVDCRLAVSLHATTDVLRDAIMPINKKYPLNILIDAIQYFNQKTKHKITFEYILISEVNDGLDDARRLVQLAKNCDAHVNVIPYNEVEGLEWKRPSFRRQERFIEALQGISVSARREKGGDIAAACGQLSLKESAAKCARADKNCLTA